VKPKRVIITVPVYLKQASNRHQDRVWQNKLLLMPFVGSNLRFFLRRAPDVIELQANTTPLANPQSQSVRVRPDL
jgi:hypothetical protein